jgi:hypothetical protein
LFCMVLKWGILLWGEKVNWICLKTNASENICC